jgi:hypothetical protein
VSGCSGRADKPRGLFGGIASDAAVAEASVIRLEGLRVSGCSGRDAAYASLVAVE